MGISRHQGRISVYLQAQNPALASAFPRKVSKVLAGQLIQHELVKPVGSSLQLLVPGSWSAVRTMLDDKLRLSSSFDPRNTGHICTQVAITKSPVILVGGLTRGEITPRRALRAEH